MLSLLDNITASGFADFVIAHQSIADSFSLTKNMWGDFADSKEHIDVYNALNPYLIKKISTNRWFGQQVSYENKLEIYIFEFTQETQKILLSNYDSIFYTDSVWKKPEDLCFYRDNRLITGSVTHEKICYLYCDLTNIPGDWSYLPDNILEQMSY